MPVSSVDNHYVEFNDLHWKEDADTPSTVDDSWPTEENIAQTCGKTSKIIAFAHEEYPLERPPINCRMLYDTVPITTARITTVEENEGSILDYSCRMILSALNFPPSPRRHSYQTKISSSGKSNHDTDDQYEDMLSGPKTTNRFRSHTVTPLPLAMNALAPPNSLKTVKGVDNLQQNNPFILHTNGAPSVQQEMVVQVPSSSGLQIHSPLPTLEDHHARALFVESFIASSPPPEEQEMYPSSISSRNKHMLSSFSSWWSSSGSRVAPNGVVAPIHGVSINSVNLALKHPLNDCHDPMKLSLPPTEASSQDNLLSTPSITPFATSKSSPNSSNDHLQGKCFDETTPRVDSTSNWLSHSRSKDRDEAVQRQPSFPSSTHPSTASLRFVNPPRSHTTSPVAFAVPRSITTTIDPDTAATMHAVRAWSSPPRQHTSDGGPPSPLMMTGPVRVVRSIRSSPINQ